jgi:hypothetical protein
MALAVIVTAGWTFPSGVPITLAALRKAGLPSVSIAGSIGAGDIGAGAVNATHLRPDAYFWALASAFASNTYAVALSPALTALAAGVGVRFTANADNTTATSLNVNGLGAVLIKKSKGADLTAGDIRNGQVVEVIYDGTFWQMNTPTGNPATYYQGTDTGAANAYAIALNPAIAALTDLVGKEIRFKAVNANTAASTLAINALAATPIKKNTNIDLAPNDIIAGQIVAMVYDGTNFCITSMLGNPDSDTAIVGASRNLVIQPNGGTPNTKVDLTADQVVVQNTSFKPVLAVNLSFTIDFGATGANGIDTGGIANSTWYYVWVIYNGTTVAGMFSLSSTAPTMPAGYTYKALVGVVRSNASSHIVGFYQTGREVLIASANIFNAKQVAAAAAVLSGGDQTNFTATVPPIAVRVTGSFGASTGLAYAAMQICTDVSGLGAQTLNVGSGITSGFNYSAATPFSLVIKGQNFAIAGDNSAGRCRLDVSGYTI